MKLSSIQKNLIKRYLLWAYKTTRESFERIERKTTQLMVDDEILQLIQRKPNLKGNSEYQQMINDFKKYIENKRQDEIKQKYQHPKKDLHNPTYIYLKNRLEAIEEIVVKLLGKNELKNFDKLFEVEFTKRIMETRDHH